MDSLQSITISSEAELRATVREALEHLWSPSLLKQSPLLDLKIVRWRAKQVSQIVTPTHLVQALQDTIREAIDSLKPPGERDQPQSRRWHPYFLLHYRYWEELAADIIASKLCISRRSLYRELSEAIGQLAEMLHHMENEFGDQTASLSTPAHLSIPNNIPIQPTPFVGRETELAELSRLLDDPVCRLMTLVGPGGIGKTRLALEAAFRIRNETAERFPDGIYLVPLVSLNSSDSLVTAILRSLNLSFHSAEEDPKKQLLDYLREKKMLLLLDSLEHLLTEETTRLLADILASVPGVKLLVTSQERVNLQWEYPLEVNGLAYPENGNRAVLEEYPAVQLFLYRAARACPRFSLSEEETPFIVNICQLLEGMPLGIEMAAAWVEVFSCQQIAQEIENDPSFLTTPLQDVPERHRSLQAVFNHSWDLLSNEERRACRRLSVFRGGFEIAAALRIDGISPILLWPLTQKSFLRKDLNGRYEMLEIVRKYAEEKLRQNPQEENEVHSQHCEYYAELLQQREKSLKRGGQKILNEISKEIENVRASWHWALEHGRLEEIDKSLEGFYAIHRLRGWHQEGNDLLQKAATGLKQMSGSTAAKHIVLGKILVRQGVLCGGLSDLEQAKELLRESLSIFRRLDMQAETAYTLNRLGDVSVALQELSNAERLFQESLEICEQIDNKELTARSLAGRGLVAFGHCNYSDAEQLYQQSLAMFEELDDRQGILRCLNSLGLVAQMRGEYTEAENLYNKCIEIAKEIGNRWAVASRLSNLGLVAEGLGEYDRAKRLHQEGLEIDREVGSHLAIASSLNNLGFVHCVLGEYREAKACFHEALELTMNTPISGLVLESLVGVAAILAEEGRAEQAVEIIAQLLDHPMTYVIAKDRAERILTELKSQLPPRTLAAAQKRGRKRDLEAYARRHWMSLLRS